MFETVKAVLFDAVGTLMRPDPAVPDVYHSLGQSFGSKLSRDEIARRFPAAFARSESGSARPPQRCEGFGTGDDELIYQRPPTNESRENLRWRRIVAEVLDDVPNPSGPLFQSLWDHFGAGRHWKLYDDAPLAWEQLQARGLIVGVASNFDRRLHQICSQIRLLRDCQNLFWSSDVGFPKPSPQFFREVQRRMGLAPHQLMLIGDDPVNDFHGARSAGWRAILLDRSDRGGCGTDTRDPNHVIHELTEVLSMLPTIGC